MNKASFGRGVGMKPQYLRRLQETEGKAMIGCILLIVLLGVMIFLVIVLAPVYYANFNLESGVRTEASRTGAHFLDNEIVIKDIINLAKRNEIRLSRENISIARYGGLVHLTIHYSVSVDFLIFERDMSFTIKESSFIGTL